MRNNWKDIVGTAMPLLAVAISTLNEIKEWLQIVSLLIGIFIGLSVLAGHILRWRVKVRSKPIPVPNDISGGQ